MIQQIAPIPPAAETVAETLRDVQTDYGKPLFDYKEAFSRNLGLISEEEQEKLRNSRVAIAGMGGVGGIHLITLARLGIGKFTIADPDTFELANMNRQYGCRMDTLGRSKAEVMAEEALRINPDVEITMMRRPIADDNLEEFLDGADLYLDGIEFFEIAARRLIFRRIAELGRYAITAGPIGNSAAWLVFAPEGMPFDDYFDLHDHMNYIDSLVAFAVGVTPRATHLGYMDLKRVDHRRRTNPSYGLACQLCAGVAATETARILLKRPGLRVAPCFNQFDPYAGRFVRGRLRGGNRNPMQRFKRWWLRRKANSMGLVAESGEIAT